MAHDSADVLYLFSTSSENSHNQTFAIHDCLDLTCMGLINHQTVNDSCANYSVAIEMYSEVAYLTHKSWQMVPPLHDNNK